MVIYHGERACQAPSQFQQLVAPLPAALQPFVPQFTYALHDLSARTDAEFVLRKHPDAYQRQLAQNPDEPAP